MMLHALLLGLGALATLLPAVAVAQKSPDPAVTEIVAYLENLQSLSADFEQERYDEYDILIERAKGHCDILRPGRFRWLYTEPYAQTIVADGTTLWIYDQDLEQVTVNPANTGQGSPAELLGAEFVVLDRYTVERLKDVDGYRWFALTPLAATSEFQRVELAWRDGEIAAMRLRDNLNQTSVLRFSALKRNTGSDPALFAFQPPLGVDVIEGAAP
jgi:outer membrane lipoprotein carrier protein